MLDLTDPACKPDAVYTGPQGNLRAERAQLLTWHGTRMQVYLDVGGVSSRRGRVCRRRGTRDFRGEKAEGRQKLRRRTSLGKGRSRFSRGERSFLPEGRRLLEEVRGARETREYSGWLRELPNPELESGSERRSAVSDSSRPHGL